MIPFSDPAMERAFLGAVLIGRGSNDHLLTLMREADFTDARCAGAYRVMFSAQREGRAIDVRLLASQLPGDDGLASLLIDAVATKANGPAYAARLRELGGLRAVSGIDGEAVAFASESFGDAIATIRLRLEAAESGREVEAVCPADIVARETFAAIERRATGREPPGLMTGVGVVDRALGGLRRGALYIVAARPGCGKSALLGGIARNVSMRDGLRSLVFSREMTRAEVAERIVADMASIPIDRLHFGRMGSGEWTRSAEAFSAFSASGLLVDDRNRLSISDLYSVAKSEHAKHPLAVVLVDYIQLVTGALRRNESREQEVAEVARGLKRLAMDLGVPVVAAAQLNREVERRSDKTPMLSDLRESGELEQSADAVIMLHREWLTDRNAPPQAAKFFLRKHRHGPIGEGELRFIGEFCRFEEVTE
jgi:replicative DNA helicase